MVQISLQNSDGKVVFLRGFHGPTWESTGVKVLWSLLSVNILQLSRPYTHASFLMEISWDMRKWSILCF